MDDNSVFIIGDAHVNYMEDSTNSDPSMTKFSGREQFGGGANQGQATNSADKETNNALKQDQRDILFRLAPDFFLSPSDHLPEPGDMDDVMFAGEVQSYFQRNIRDFYVSSGIREEVARVIENSRPGASLDEVLLDVVTARAIGTNNEKGIYGVTGMLPNFNTQKEGASLECTLASSMLKCAMEDAGMPDARTALISGHQVLVRQLSDGGVKYYDAATRITGDDGIAHGFSHTFSPDEIENTTPIGRADEQDAFTFRIRTKKEMIGRVPAANLLNYDAQTNDYQKNVFVHGKDILIDLGTAIANIAEIPSRTDEADQEFIARHPIVRAIDIQKMQSELGILNAKQYLEAPTS